jgi:Mrp family chromosome partitioning ATPase
VKLKVEGMEKFQLEEVEEMTPPAQSTPPAQPSLEEERPSLGQALDRVSPLPLHDGAEDEDEETTILTRGMSVVDTPRPPLLPDLDVPLPEVLPRTPHTSFPVWSQKKTSKRTLAKAERDATNTRLAQDRCRQICCSLFFREQAPVRSLGFTSSIHGEGKSFLSMITADVLARDSSEPVALLECNWDHPCFSDYFDFAPAPGLAEWVRGECEEEDIRHKVASNLTVIPAGNARRQNVKVLQMIRQKRLLHALIRQNELLVVDLPAMAISGDGSLAVTLVESLIVVVRVGVTPNDLIAATCQQLKDRPVHGLLLNQVKSNIPQWLRQIL